MLNLLDISLCVLIIFSHKAISSNASKIDSVFSINLSWDLTSLVSFNVDKLEVTILVASSIWVIEPFSLTISNSSNNLSVHFSNMNYQL